MSSSSRDDIVLDWTSDPVAADRFAVYKLAGPGFGEAVRIGSTTERTFEHPGAASASESFDYCATAVDAWGSESALQ